MVNHTDHKGTNKVIRIGALILSFSVLLSSFSSSVWAESLEETDSALPPAAEDAALPDEENAGLSCDETYYAMLDYYGGLTEGSIVKSYRLNGAASIKDYGLYDEVINLTDNVEPAHSDGAVQFQFPEGQSPERFYFEGRTSQVYDDLPWHISVSYRLNGVEKTAEELAGQTGLVEINIDAIPNPNAGEYEKNNFVLTQAAVFNDSSILSLEAEGAQIQLLGNLRAVIFMVMPGEERHFTIRVGAESFEFGGMTFLVVPATLAQLEQIADLNQAKDELEGSYDKLNDSLDQMLNSLDGVSAGLRDAASGLNALDSAREQISDGKDETYASADMIIGSLNEVEKAMEPINSYLDTAGKAVSETNAQLESLSGNAEELKSQLEETRALITDIQKKTKQLSRLVGMAELYTSDAPELISGLRLDLASLRGNLGSLEKNLAAMESTLRTLQGSRLDPFQQVTIEGMTPDELQAQLQTVVKLHQGYEQAVAAGYPGSFEQFAADAIYKQAVAAALEQAGLSPDTDPSVLGEEILMQMQQTANAKAASASALWDVSQGTDMDSLLKAVQQINSMIGSSGDSGTVNGALGQASGLIQAISGPTADLMSSLKVLLQDINDEDALCDHLDEVLVILENLARVLKEEEGGWKDGLDDLDKAGDLLSAITQNADNTIDTLQSLQQTLNQYEPTIQSALQDGKTLSSALSGAVGSTKNALSTLKKQMQNSGAQLNDGARQTLRALSTSLNQTANGLNGAKNIRDAKNSITSIIDDEWNSHAGGSSNMLMMDAGAPAKSLTSPENPTPSTIQIVMRTQEIKGKDKVPSEQGASDERKTPSFLGRLSQMFEDLFTVIAGIFH